MTATLIPEFQAALSGAALLLLVPHSSTGLESGILLFLLEYKRLISFLSFKLPHGVHVVAELCARDDAT